MDLVYLMRSGLRIPDYWHPHLEIQTDFLSGKIGLYPVIMDAKADYPGQLNREGVPIVFLSKNPCIFPVTVALYGLGNHDVFLNTGNKSYHRKMMSALRWFENHPVPLGEGVGWPNEQEPVTSRAVSTGSLIMGIADRRSSLGCQWCSAMDHLCQRPSEV
jgi:hypothetical protein